MGVFLFVACGGLGRERERGESVCTVAVLQLAQAERERAGARGHFTQRTGVSFALTRIIRAFSVWERRGARGEQTEHEWI